MKGAETLVSLITDLLQDNLDTYLDATTATSSNETNTPHVTHYYITENYTPKMRPAIFVVPTKETTDPEGGNTFHGIDSYMVVLVCEAEKEKYLQLQAFRYARALMNVLHLTELDDTDFRAIIRVDEIEYSPTMPSTGAKGMFDKEVVLKLRVDRFEPLNLN